MDKKLVLLGGGGHCKSVLDAALRMDIFDSIVITDPNMPVGSEVFGCKVVGTDDCLKQLRRDGFNLAFITVGSVKVSNVREHLVEKAKRHGFAFPIIKDPSAIVSDRVEIGEGTFVGKGVAINADTTVGAHCIINTGAIVEHECRIGDYSHISVGTVLCGAVNVGRNSLVGAGSTVIQCVSVGNNVTVGANSTVLSDVENNSTVYGVVNRK
ncbi:sugar O-acyltransferase, sialic acid O-acetyltransferase NeuD family [Lachnospiraceae bacterium C10]|nr:sugar O-acyltransferase, sialic acid O-acetyltransferase NeuD family [Lachnospiraceae bacterium C10]